MVGNDAELALPVFKVSANVQTFFVEGTKFPLLTMPAQGHNITWSSLTSLVSALNLIQIPSPLHQACERHNKEVNLTKSVLDLNALIQTLVGKHESGKFCCLTCGKLFEAKQSVERHAEIHLGLSHHCIVCDKVFNTRNTLATHYTKQHPNEVATPWAMKLK